MSSKPLIPFKQISEDHPYFLDPEEYPGWRELFDNDRPLVFEIGFGNGNFLLDIAVTHPDRNFIGMDFYHKGIRRLFMRIDRHGLTNIRIAYGNASEKVPFLFRDDELDEVYINFPDPWPKKRHHKRRLIKENFVHCLAEKIKPGGRLHLATDFEAYAEEMLEILNAETLLRNLSPERGFFHDRQDTPRTKYEKNFLNAGKTIYYLEFERVAPGQS